VAGAPQNTVIGGASLWVMSQEAGRVQGRGGVSSASCPTPSAVGQPQRTGYLPITMAAYPADREVGFYKENPAPTWR